MALAYTPPGVDVQEVTTPVVAPLLSVAASVCLVGLSSGFIQKTEVVTLNGSTAAPLTGVPSGSTMATTAVILAMNATNPADAPAGYVVGNTVTNGTQIVFDATAHTVARNPTATTPVPDASIVYVTYQYTTPDYFSPIRLDNLSDIEARFGSAWDTTGTTINSPLSQAAAVALENGAGSIVLQPLFFNNGGVLTQPSNAQNAASATWSSTLLSLRAIEDINIIVPVVGQSQPNVGDATVLSIIQTIQDHMKFMLDDDEQYIVAIAGEDASASNSVAQKPTIITHAGTLAARYGGQLAEATVLIDPAKFTRAAPATGNEVSVGGQYAAAAVAGKIAGAPVSQALTRKAISGFVSVTDPRTKAEKNAAAAAGLMVIEQRGTTIQVRHGLTLNTTGGTTKKELSIVRAKYRTIESIKDTIDTQIIGQVFADSDAPGVVADAVTATLQVLADDGDIVSYKDVAARTLTIDPTHIEVRFSYRPALPVNFVTIAFSIDLTTGDLTVPTTTTAATAG